MQRVFFYFWDNENKYSKKSPFHQSNGMAGWIRIEIHFNRGKYNCWPVVLSKCTVKLRHSLIIASITMLKGWTKPLCKADLAESVRFTWYLANFLDNTKLAQKSRCLTASSTVVQFTSTVSSPRQPCEKLQDMTIMFREALYLWWKSENFIWLEQQKWSI